VYESRNQRPLHRRAFIQRMLWHGMGVVGLVALSTLLGMAGYMAFERLSPLDAFLNAAMLLGGMGPVDAPKTDTGKLFAGLYALYAGLVFLLTAAVMFTPIVHRLLHRFHWTEDER
jgi:hypothetical protein